MTLRMTTPTRLVLTALAQAEQPTYGYDICRAANLLSGTVYPILARLAAHELVTSTDEEGRHPGRPPRRYYQLTEIGREKATAVARREITPE